MPSSDPPVVFCYVYVLYSNKHNQKYIGYTHKLKGRLAEHNKGLNRSTKAYLPWELVYYEAHTNEMDARRREKYLKTTAGRQALNNMLREKFNQMSDLNEQGGYY